eukprot:s2782_g3.t4
MAVALIVWSLWPKPFAVFVFLQVAILVESEGRTAQLFSILLIARVCTVMAIPVVAGCVFGGEMLKKMLDKFEKVGVTLIREGGKEVKGIIDHSEKAGERLICKVGDEVKLAIDQVHGKMELLTDHLAGKAQLLLEGAGLEARLCLDHMQKNVIMVLDHLPKVAGKAAEEAAVSALAGVRKMLGLRPAAWKLVYEIDRALREGEKTPYELVELVWQQPETDYSEKYYAYVLLFKFFQVQSNMTFENRFAVQFFISFVALKDHVPESFPECLLGCLPFSGGRRDPCIFIKGLVRLKEHQKDLHARAVRLLKHMNSMTDRQITNETFSIMTELRPPQLEAPREAPREEPRGVCKKGLEAIRRDIEKANLDAERWRDMPEKDSEVNGFKQTIQKKIDQLKADHPTFLSSGLEADTELCKDLHGREDDCRKIEPLRSKDLLLKELHGKGFRWSTQQSNCLPESMPWSEYDRRVNKDYVFRIRSVTDNRLYIHVAGHEFKNGADIRLWDKPDEYQGRWKWDGDRIVLAKTPRFCISIVGTDRKYCNGKNIHLWERGICDNQQWSRCEGSSYVRFNLMANTNFYIHHDMDSPKKGANILLWRGTPKTNDQWELEICSFD